MTLGAAKRKKLAPWRAVVEKDAKGRLASIADIDATLVAQSPIGRQFELVPIRRARSNEQLRLYFGLLTKVADATGLWPTAGHLHEVLVRRAGYVTPALDPATGEYVEVRDSVAFDAMEPDEFKRYMDASIAILGEALGVDPMTLLSEGAAA